MLWKEYNVLDLLNKEELNVPDKKKWPTFAYPPFIQNDCTIDYLIFNDIGINVKVIYPSIASQMKINFINKMREDVRIALDHSHGLGWCHCDVRIENILAFEDGNRDYNFQLIDWGLARENDGNMHEHTGGVDFFHDDIVNQSKNDQINVFSLNNIVSLLYCLIALNSYVKGKHTYTWKTLQEVR